MKTFSKDKLIDAYTRSMCNRINYVISSYHIRLAIEGFWELLSSYIFHYRVKVLSN